MTLNQLDVQVQRKPKATAIVTARHSAPSSEVTAITPPGDPDVTIKPLSIAVRLAIRFLKVYISTVILLLLAGAASFDPTAPNEAVDKVLHAFQFALYPAFGTLLLNLSILLTKLDEKYPSVMG